MSLLHHSTRYSIKLGLALLTLSFGISMSVPALTGTAIAQDSGEKLPNFLNEYIQGRMQQEETQSKVQVKGLVERDGRFYVSQETKLFVVATPRHPYLPINSISVKLDESDWYVYSGDTLHDVSVGDLSNPDGTIPPSATASADLKSSETALLNAKKTGFFSIPFISNRARTLQVKATDILGNESAPFKTEVYVDVTPPYVEVAIESMDPMAGLAKDLDVNSSLGDELPLIPAYREGDLFYVGPKYRITVDAFDTEAGVDKNDNSASKLVKRYNEGAVSIWQGDQKPEAVTQFYVQPIGWLGKDINKQDLIGGVRSPDPNAISHFETREFHLEPGKVNLIRVQAMDRVGNTTSIFSFKIYVDIKPPEISGPLGFVGLEDDTGNYPCLPVCELPQDTVNLVEGQGLMDKLMGSELKKKARNLNYPAIFAKLNDGFSYTAKDPDTGLDVHSMYVRIDGRAEPVIGSDGKPQLESSGIPVLRPRWDPYRGNRSIQFSSSGLHEIDIKALDLAGNVANETWFVYVISDGPSTIFLRAE